MVELYPYQREGVEFLSNKKTALLADDPGLGKTLQAIRACDEAMALFVLVICPASVVENWKREIAKYRQGDWSAFVTSYDNAVGKDFRRITERQWCVIILDEGHLLKSLSTKRTKGIYGQDAALPDDCVAAKGLQVWVLTATPMPNHSAELYPHLRALYPEVLISPRTGKIWSYYQFEAAYCVLKNNGFGQQIVGTRNDAKLHEKLKGFMLRRRKADVLKDLPPIRFADLYLDADVDGIDFEEAEKVRKALAEEGIDGLRRISFDGGVAKLRRLTGMAKAKPAAAWVKDWLDATPNDRKIVLFAHHTDVIEYLYDQLCAVAVRVHGGMKQNERQRAVDRLQEDPKIRVFIGQIQAAGTGITLTRASDLLFVEHSWVPAENEQAAQRIHRIGQTEPCLVRTGIIPGSIDEDISRAVSRKMKSISAVIDGCEERRLCQNEAFDSVRSLRLDSGNDSWRYGRPVGHHL